MAQIVDAHIWQIGLLPDFEPEAADFPHWLADGIAGKEPYISFGSIRISYALSDAI